jgi:hypothetical protein
LRNLDGVANGHNPGVEKSLLYFESKILLHIQSKAQNARYHYGPLSNQLLSSCFALLSSNPIFEEASS